MARTRSGERGFQAVLERDHRNLGWTVARVPFPPAELGEMVRLRVRGEISGPTGERLGFRTSLFPDPRGGFFLLVNRTMQASAHLHLGDTADFLLAADRDPRPAEIPDELATFLDDEPDLRAWFTELSESMRREIGKWVAAPKTDEARLHRAEQMAERLMLAMEGERELPPVLERAFRERPRARAGWADMTPVQRRGELLAIFYYQTPEARDRRVAKLCDAAEKRA
jgi:uncharacterized protein YdeI (YjbR/CyaY-like superfamily)